MQTVVGGYFDAITNPRTSGPAVGALIRVYLTGTTTLAPLLTAAGGTGAANPATVDGNGNLTFYADAAQRYDLALDSTGVVFGTGIALTVQANELDQAGAAAAYAVVFGG